MQAVEHLVLLLAGHIEGAEVAGAADGDDDPPGLDTPFALAVVVVDDPRLAVQLGVVGLADALGEDQLERVAVLLDVAHPAAHPGETSLDGLFAEVFEQAFLDIRLLVKLYFPGHLHLGGVLINGLFSWEVDDGGEGFAGLEDDAGEAPLLGLPCGGEARGAPADDGDVEHPPPLHPPESSPNSSAILSITSVPALTDSLSRGTPLRSPTT